MVFLLVVFRLRFGVSFLVIFYNDDFESWLFFTARSFLAVNDNFFLIPTVLVVLSLGYLEVV